MTAPDKVDIADIQPLWGDVVTALNNQSMNPGPVNYVELQNAISTYAAGMYELGLYNGYTQGIVSATSS